MSDGKNIRDDRIESRVEQLPQDVMPETDLWPGIAAAIAPASPDVDALVAQLPADIDPADGLWPGVAARLTRGKSASQASGNPVSRPGGPWTGWSLAAGIALAAIVGYALIRPSDPVEPGASGDAWLAEFGTDSRAAIPALEEARRTYREQIAAVRDERKTIEASLALYPGDAGLQALWLHVYETELHLIDDAERVLTTIQAG